MKNFLLWIFDRKTLAQTATNTKILKILSKDEYWVIRYYVAYNPNTSPETLEFLSKDEYYGVRCRVSRNHKTNPETLDVLSKDEYPTVRCCVAENPNCPERVYKYIKGLELLRDLQKALEGPSNSL